MEGLNMDLHQMALLDLAAEPWRRSPGGEVERRMIEREHAESGHTTSVVRYPPRSRFPAHGHPGGEEFIVLEGVFSDEHGDYPAGTYLRNPVGFEHAPFSQDGCTIFVKLCQMPEGSHRVVQPESSLEWKNQGRGLAVATLHEDDHERVDLLTAQQATQVAAANTELLLLEGELRVAGRRMAAPAWVRIPDGPMVEIELGAKSKLWRKRGHLPAAG